MAAINLEMLRELLGEFTEKELVLREERDIIEQQIVELDSRIEQNKKKLDGLSKDREKVDAMRERYLSGNWKIQQEQNGRENSRLVSLAPAAYAPAAQIIEATPQPAPAPVEEAPAPVVIEAVAPTAPEIIEPEPVQEAAPRDYSKPQISGIAGPAPAVTTAPAPEKSADSNQAYASANATSQSLPAQSPTVEPLHPPVQAPEVAAQAAPEPAPAPRPIISAPPVEALAAPAPEPTPPPAPEPAQASAPAPEQAPIIATISAPPPAAPAAAPVSDPILNALGNAPPVSAPDVMPSITPVVSTHASDEAAQTSHDQAQAAIGYGSAAHGAGAPVDPWGFGGPSAAQAPDTVPGAYPPGSPMDAWGAPSPEPIQPQIASAPFADIAAAANAIQVPNAEGAPQSGGPGWGDFGEDWITPGSKEAAPGSTADSLPTINPGDQMTAPPQAQPQTPSAVTGWGDWGDGSQAQLDTPPAAAPNWGQPSPQAAQPSAPQAAPQAAFPEAPAAESTGGGWGQPQPQAQPNFSQPPVNNNPWGAPTASGAIGASPGSLPPGTPSPAFDNPWGTPSTSSSGGESETEAKPSSLAGAAGGALLSNPRNRRRREAQPAFDWGGGEGDSGQAQNPGQPQAQAQPPVADWGQPQPQASVADWGQPQAADSSDNSSAGAAKGEEVDEGAKKINDALRGLFKK
jgi:hypothetical protein